LGPAVTNWSEEEAQRGRDKADAEAARLRRNLDDRRLELHKRCAVDICGQQQEAANAVVRWEQKAAVAERRLRGLLLLDTVLRREKVALGELLAGKLNEQLTPWLQALRGRETKLVLDEGGSTIVAVETQGESGLVSLPIEAHSQGLREQIVLALRLALAVHAAQQQPSGKLPLVLDDPFTQSDSDRRQALAQLLEEATPHLQILFVTCHDDPFPKGAVGMRTLVRGRPAPQ
jgi:uncharacterized protein YhaN